MCVCIQTCILYAYVLQLCPLREPTSWLPQETTKNPVIHREMVNSRTETEKVPDEPGTIRCARMQGVGLVREHDRSLKGLPLAKSETMRASK